MLTRANKVIEKRDVTWESPPDIEVLPVQLQQSASPELAGAPEQGGTSEVGETPEPRGERRSVSGENLPTPETRAAPPDVYLSSESNEASADGDMLVEESDTSSSDESRPLPTMVRTAGRAPN